MSSYNISLVISSLLICVGLFFIGYGINTGIKYGMTRYACLNQKMTPEECTNWNNTWEN